MIKLVIIARCIPETVYLQHLETGRQLQQDEKRFSIVVRDPETWYIGRLAVEIKNRYENLYKRPFGQVKYLKDDEDDCDLDPELSVADLLVDEGKAARDGADQKRAIKVIQEGGRALRQGSVIPDLTPVHYQPPVRPPVPAFPTAEKRPLPQPESIRPNKRLRLGQIEEESDNVLRSIEDGDVNGHGHGRGHGRGRRSPSQFHLQDADFLQALNGTTNGSDNTEIKQESPESTRKWPNTGVPATRDELEFLPEAPTNWPNRISKTTTNESQVQVTPSTEHRSTYESEEAPEPNAAEDENTTASTEVQDEQPVTPHGPVTMTNTHAGQTVSLLNGLKSGHSATKHATNSAKKFSRADPYAFDESDIDDSQMSPRSKAARINITPKGPAVAQQKDSGKPPSRLPFVKQSIATAQKSDNNADDQIQGQHGGSSTMQPPSWTRDGFAGLNQKPSTPQNPQRQTTSASTASRSSTGSFASASEGRNKEKGKRDRTKRRTKDSKYTSSSGANREASEASSDISAATNNTPARSNQQTVRAQSVANGDDMQLDSPSVQLEDELQRSSPRPSEATSSSRSASKSSSSLSRPGKPQGINDSITRPPDSVSDVEEDVPPLFKTPKRPKLSKMTKTPSTRGKTPAKTPAKTPSRSTPTSSSFDLRCYRCWAKGSKCDRLQPKCTRCVTESKNCQYYDMTKEEAKQEMADRKAGKTKNPAKSVLWPARARSHPPSSTHSDSDDSDDTGTSNKENNLPQVHVLTGRAVDTSQPSADRSMSRNVPRPPTQTASTTSSDSQSSMVESDPAPIHSRPLADLTQLTFPIGEVTSAEPETEESGDSDLKDAQRPSLPQFPVDSPPQIEMLQPIEQTMQDKVIIPNTQQMQISLAVPQTEIRSASPTILPPGMTREQYDALIQSREKLTDQDRQAQKLNAKKSSVKLDARETKSPAPQKSIPKLKKQSSSILTQSSQPSPTPQPTLDRLKEQTSALFQSAQRASETPKPTELKIEKPKSAAATTKRKSSPTSAVSRPTPTPALVHSSSKGRPSLGTAASNLAAKKSKLPMSKPKLSEQAVNSASKRDQPKKTERLNNPPYRPPQAIGEVKSLKDMRTALSRQGSNASTPQPRLMSKLPPVSLGLSDEDDTSSSDDATPPAKQVARPAAKPAPTKVPPKPPVKTIQRPVESDSSSSSDSGSD